LVSWSCTGGVSPKAKEGLGISPLPLTARQSDLAKHLRRDAGLDSALADIIDNAFPTMWEASLKFAPCPQVLSGAMPPKHREETIGWLLQAFDIMRFGETHFFGAAQLLDRYYSCTPDDQRFGCAQRRLLAAVSLALKTGTSADMSMPTRQAITHLGKEQVPFDEVMAAELDMLQQLDFQVCVPNVLDFLEGFSIRLRQAQQPVDNRCMFLANFLLQLTVSDVHLHYGHPHGTLAVAALLLAVGTWYSPESGATFMSRVIEDAELCCPELCWSRDPLQRCMERIHGLWICATTASQRGSFVWHVCAKFSRPNQLNVASLPPPTSVPRLPPSTKSQQARLPRMSAPPSVGASNGSGSGSSSSSNCSGVSGIGMGSTTTPATETTPSARSSSSGRAHSLPHGCAVFATTDSFASEAGRHMRTIVNQRERTADRELPSKKLDMARLRRRLRAPDGVSEEDHATAGWDERPPQQLQQVRPRRASSWASGSRLHSASSSTIAVAPVPASVPGAAASTGMHHVIAAHSRPARTSLCVI